LTAVVWLLPPAVLPAPSRSGPEGPPSPYGLSPRVGGQPAPTAPGLAAAQNRALLDGPFPRTGESRGVSDGTLVMDPEQSTRALAVARIRASGSLLVRIPVDWRDVVSANPPPSFDPADPGDAAYHFGLIDTAVREAVAGGLTPVLVVSHAPAFAEAPGRWPYAYPGSWDPSPAALGSFAAALARRYDGSFADPTAPGRSLPRVGYLQAWNEPNLARYLEPQWVAGNGRWEAFSPLIYRRLLDAFYAGVKSVSPADVVITAGVAPDGDPEGEGRMAPVRFLRALLCLRPRRGSRSALVREPCPEPAHFDALAFHPLSVASPDAPAGSSLDVSIADAGKVTALLAAARRLHTALPVGPKALWVTELNWESFPEAPDGVPPALQAAWISRALHRLWVAGVSVVMWSFLVDPDRDVLAQTPTGGTFAYPRPAGLYAAGPDGNPLAATPKPFLTGFSFPFDPLRVDRSSIRLWALAAGAGEAITLERRSADGQWRSIEHLRAGRSGVLNVLLRLRGRATLRLRSQSATSAAAGVGSRRSRL
jgi:hypothetical protein